MRLLKKRKNAGKPGCRFAEASISVNNNLLEYKKKLKKWILDTIPEQKYMKNIPHLKKDVRLYLQMLGDMVYSHTYRQNYISSVKATDILKKLKLLKLKCDTPQLHQVWEKLCHQFEYILEGDESSTESDISVVYNGQNISCSVIPTIVPKPPAQIFTTQTIEESNTTNVEDENDQNSNHTVVQNAESSNLNTFILTAETLISSKHTVQNFITAKQNLNADSNLDTPVIISQTLPSSKHTVQNSIATEQNLNIEDKQKSNDNETEKINDTPITTPYQWQETIEQPYSQSILKNSGVNYYNAYLNSQSLFDSQTYEDSFLNSIACTKNDNAPIGIAETLSQAPIEKVIYKDVNMSLANEMKEQSKNNDSSPKKKTRGRPPHKRSNQQSDKIINTQQEKSSESPVVRTENYTNIFSRMNITQDIDKAIETDKQNSLHQTETEKPQDPTNYVLNEQSNCANDLYSTYYDWLRNVNRVRSHDHSFGLSLSEIDNIDWIKDFD